MLNQILVVFCDTFFFLFPKHIWSMELMWALEVLSLVANGWVCYMVEISFANGG